MDASECSCDLCVDIWKFQAYLLRPLGTFGFVNGSESCDGIQVRKTHSPIEWLPANRWRMPGSWRRSRLSEIDSPLTGPSEPAAPEGFLFSGAWSFEIPPAKPERETRIPGLAQARARPKRGACWRERGASRTPMAERTREGFAMAARR